MSAKTIKLLAFLVLLVHGIGHLQGVVSSLGVKYTGSTSNISWLFKGMSRGFNRVICLNLYLFAGVFAILAALSYKGILIQFSAWQTLALLSAFGSILSLVLFPNALAMFFNKAGAIAVNLIILYSILLNVYWPAAVFED